jgi:hypothetical protein
MKMSNFPELTDFIQDIYFENEEKFKTIREFLEMLKDVSIDSGMDLTTLQGLINDSWCKCLELENEEPKISEFEFVNNQIKEMAIDLNN